MHTKYRWIFSDLKVSRMDGRIAFAIGDVFSLSSSFDYRISKKFGSNQQRQGLLLCEQWFETEKHVYSVDSLAVECHWLRFIRATTTRGRTFPLRISFLREMAEDQLLLFPSEINLFALFVEGKVSWIIFFSFFHLLFYS